MTAMNKKPEYMDYKQVLRIIAAGARNKKTVKIYYPKTESSAEGWREVEPYSLTTDTGEEGEHLIYGKDRLSPGHIFNGYTVGSTDDHCDSFIVGKIKSVQPTTKKFKPRNNWKIEF